MPQIAHNFKLRISPLPEISNQCERFGMHAGM